MSAQSFLPWQGPREGERGGMAKLDFRDIVLVAGTDPFAHKGVEERHRAFVRPAGDGGCSDGLDYDD